MIIKFDKRNFKSCSWAQLFQNFTLFWILDCPLTFAEGAGHGHGSIKDLFYPTINFLILVMFLVMKLNRPLREYFKNYSQSIKDSFENAESHYREANLKLEFFQKKMKDIDRDCQNVSKKAEDDLAQFLLKQKRESEEKISRMRLETTHRIEQEKQTEIKKLHREVVNAIILEAKSSIDGDTEKQTLMTQKLQVVLKNSKYVTNKSNHQTEVKATAS